MIQVDQIGPSCVALRCGVHIVIIECNNNHSLKLDPVRLCSSWVIWHALLLTCWYLYHTANSHHLYIWRLFILISCRKDLRLGRDLNLSKPACFSACNSILNQIGADILDLQNRQNVVSAFNLCQRLTERRQSDGPLTARTAREMRWI